METKLFNWLGREFIEIRAEGSAARSKEVAARELFDKFAADLQSHDLSFDNAVRSRVWGRDKEARTVATAVRSKVLGGQRKVGSSSFIADPWFDSAGAVGLELLAMRPVASSAARRNAAEFEPARNYLCYLEYDGWIFFSGFTAETPTLEQQVIDIVNTLDGALSRARIGWSEVKKLSLLLLRGQDLETARSALVNAGRPAVPEIEATFVDGFAGDTVI